LRYIATVLEGETRREVEFETNCSAAVHVGLDYEYREAVRACYPNEPPEGLTVQRLAGSSRGIVIAKRGLGYITLGAIERVVNMPDKPIPPSKGDRDNKGVKKCT